MDTMATLVKYMIHIYDMTHSGTWDRRTNLVYFTDFITESLVIVRQHRLLSACLASAQTAARWRRCSITSTL